MMRVLGIDDDGAVLRLIGEFLAGEGIEFVGETDAAAGLAAAAAGTFDVVLTDLIMPATDGIEVIRKLRSKHPHLRIVAMSGGGSSLSGKTFLTMAAKLGADAVLQKPFGRKDLLAALRPA